MTTIKLKGDPKSQVVFGNRATGKRVYFIRGNPRFSPRDALIRIPKDSTRIGKNLAGNRVTVKKIPKGSKRVVYYDNKRVLTDEQKMVEKARADLKSVQDKNAATANKKKTTSTYLRTKTRLQRGRLGFRKRSAIRAGKKKEAALWAAKEKADLSQNVRDLAYQKKAKERSERLARGRAKLAAYRRMKAKQPTTTDDLDDYNPRATRKAVKAAGKVRSQTLSPISSSKFGKWAQPRAVSQSRLARKG